VNYRVSSGLVRTEGVIPNSRYNRVNVTGASTGQATKWLNADLSMQYVSATNDQPFKGDNGPLVGLLVWPSNDNAADYLTPAGTRRRVTTLTQGAEVDNPYFNVAKNKINSRNNRVIANLAFTLTPFSWGSLKTQLGTDNYTNQNLILRNPESAYGFSNNGILDQATDVTRNLTSQTILTLNAQPILPNHLWVNGLLGNAIYDNQSNVMALTGTNFLDPNFVSINNTSSRASLTTLGRFRRVGAFGQASLDFNHYWYVNVQGRNDWTSTIPRPKNSFFYPSVSTSFVFSDAFPSVRRFVTGRVKAAYADAGRDASPYAYTPALEYKTTTGNGYGYGFWGPNRNLKPEFKKEYEFGAELGFFKDRLSIEPTMYRSRTQDQIVQNIRGSYGTGFILFNLNGATTRNQGLELVVRGTPVQQRDLSWDVLVNFDKHHGKVLSLPHDLVESYVSDTWLYGNVRAGTMPGLSTESLTGLFYLRNKEGKLLIDPTTGLPIRSADFIDAGYDRTPKYTVGLTNTIRYRKVSLDFLIDFRRGGDIFNATEQFLTARGLATSTLDRNTPRIIPGVLRDGKENTANPTPNNVVVVPAVNTGYYTGMSEELFIEKNINWMWLREVTLHYQLPPRIARNASLFVTGNDLFLTTNYTGLDPMTNGNTAAVGGSGAVGIDYANFPTPRSFNFGLKLGF
jgi:TonB dependent receptor